MKYIFLSLGLIFLLAGISCSKSNGAVSPVGFTVVNAIVNDDVPSLVVNFDKDSVKYFNNANQIFGNSFVEYSPLSGDRQVTIIPINDTSKVIYSGKLDLLPGKTYTLFIAGADAMHPDTLFSHDTPPYHSSMDSVAGVRFVNLIPGSTQISVNIKGSANGSEIVNLPYKGISDYKAYSSNASISKYVFEIRDAESGALLTTYNYSKIARFRNVTVVVNGTENTTMSFLVNDY